MNRARRLIAFGLAVAAAADRARADYLTDTGYYELKALAGSDLPDGRSVAVTQVETGNPGYIPEAGSGTFAATGTWFAGKTFRALCGASEAGSHARDVAMHYYGRNTLPSQARAGMTPGILTVDFYNASGSDSWLEDAWLRPGNAAPLAEIRAVQNHSWITGSSPARADSLNDTLRRVDFAIDRDGFLCVVGVNNALDDGDPPPVPALLAGAYNVLAVGLTTGRHSTGGVPAELDGPGRIRPEIVAPLDYTSFSTALTSSAGALLRARADAIGADAARPETLKAVLLAGATKDEFPGWANAPSQPLDPLFGAGELNVLHSWRILTAGPRAPGDVPADAGWWRLSLNAGQSRTWRIAIPSDGTARELSAVAVWHRIVRNGSRRGFSPEPDPLTNYNLAWEPASQSMASAAAYSRSSIDNVEHIFRRSVPGGTWRLTLSNDSGSAVPVTVAWRISPPVAAAPAIAARADGSGIAIVLTGLESGRQYRIDAAADARRWTAVESFTADGADRTWRDPSAIRGRRFYRLATLASP